MKFSGVSIFFKVIRKKKTNLVLVLAFVLESNGL